MSAVALKDILNWKQYGGAHEDRKIWIVWITSALCLTLIHFWGRSLHYHFIVDFLSWLGADQWAASIRYALSVSPNGQLNRLIYWALICVTGYLIIPALVVVFILREPLSAYGLKTKGMLEYWKIYAVMAAIILPCVVVVSYESGFQSTYPFYMKEPGKPMLPAVWYWDFFYALQFFALEFFFRGFMIHGSKHKMGVFSVAAMMAPYCMIHFNKPLPECVGSIVAGFVLGLLSYRSNSVWLGAAIHIVVAVLMDHLSMWHQGWLHF